MKYQGFKEFKLTYVEDKRSGKNKHCPAARRHTVEEKRGVGDGI
jgi:hypothetical protein